jgi:hypothetical protein
VREEVRNILMQSPAFRAMSAQDRQETANAMVKIANYMVGGADGRTTPTSVSLADERPYDPAGQTAGERFAYAGAGAVNAGVDALVEAIQGVDFPGFVGGLIKGVFQAVVDASIQQMEAYAELVKNVAKSVDQFMQENVTENQARDYLVGRYPEYLELNMEDEQPRVLPKEGHNEDALPPFFQDLGLAEPVESLDEETTEQVLMPAARQRLAMDRQQLLATMVLMGINRIIVTDGTIRASVVFDLKTEDSVRRNFDYTRTHASAYEELTKEQSRSGWFSSWFRPYTRDRTTKLNVNTESAMEKGEDSESRVELKAKLAGNVDLRFRSETFPLERMADVLSINQINQNARPSRENATANDGTGSARNGSTPAPTGTPAPGVNG